MTITPTDNGADSSLLTLERIFKDKEFDTKGAGPYQWLADESGYIVLETADSPSDDKNKQQNIVRYNIESGESQVLAAAEQLTPEGEDKPLKVSNFQWSEETERLLVFTNTKRVWRTHAQGDYWLLDTQSQTLKKLGGEAAPSSLLYAKFSPDGRSVAYARESNIYVECLESGEGVRGEITQLTTDGSQTITNGTADWVNEEELYLRDCFKWSPDGRYIAYWQFDTSGVETFHMINNTDSLYPKLIPFPYPKVGSVNSAVRVGVVPAVGGETTWFDVEGDPREHYIHKMAWCKDSAAVIFQQVDRYQHCNKVIFGNVKDGSVEVVLTEEDETWVDLHDGLKLLGDGRSFTWLSDRDGWRHLYLVSGDGREVQLLTPGDYDVIEVQGVDEANGLVYFTASPENFTRRYLYRAALDGSSQVKRVTPAGQPGTHSYEMSPKARLAFQTYDAFCLPPVTALVSLPDHKQLKMVEGNEGVHEKVAALNQPAVEFFKVKIAEEIVLDGWCLKPADLDPNQQYPLLLHIYGEPSGLTVKDVWSGSKHIWHWYLAQQGFIVMSVDGHGTPSPRGRTWRKSMYKQVGTKSAADQAAALKVILAERPYIDPERVGIWGWSGGGTMTLNMLFRYPELYKTGVAVAAVCDQRLYDTIYQERYMGPLAENEEAYIEGSPITHAHNLEGNLLLIHGTADDNVHYQCFERLVNELITHNKQFSAMVYPNRTHAIKEGKNTSLHLHTLMTRYLVEHLLESE